MAQWKWDEDRKAWRKELWCNGRRTKLTFYGTKKEAEEYEARKRVELGAAGIVRERDAPRFETFCVDVYKPHAKAHLRASTWNIRRYQLAPLIEHFGGTKLAKIGTAHVEAFKAARVQEVGKVSVNNELAVLSAVLTYARETLKLPCAKPNIKRFPVRKKKGRVQFFSREEVGLILAACPADFLPLVTFLFETGVRKSEALNLPWSNVLFDQRMVRIWSEAEEGEQEYEVKSVEREVPLSDHVLRVLREQKLLGLSRRWVFPVRRNNQDYTKGEKYACWPKHTWAKVLSKATELAQEKDPKAKELKGGPHKARHTFASFFLASKPDLFLLGRLLGHSNSQVTELYSHLVPEHLAEARNVVTFASAK